MTTTDMTNHIAEQLARALIVRATTKTPLFSTELT